MIDFNRINAPKNRPGICATKQKMLVAGTVEEVRINKRSKRQKKERIDAVYRPMAGYIWDSDSHLWAWSSMAMLRESAYDRLDNTLESCEMGIWRKK